MEDLVTSGASVLETVAPLQARRRARRLTLQLSLPMGCLQDVGLIVSDVVVLIDRQQGGEAHLASKARHVGAAGGRGLARALTRRVGQGLRLHAALPITLVLDTLVAHGKVDGAVAAAVRAFIDDNQTAVPAAAAAVQAAAALPVRRLTYGARAELATNAAGARLLVTMERKRSNLCVAADVRSCAAVLQLAEEVGPYICCLKTHVDMLDDFTPAFGAALAAAAARHDFLVFEDRKFADIGNTVVAQYGGGVYRIADWSDLTNAHCVPGPGIVDGLASVGLPAGRGLLLLAEMSSAGTLANGAYTAAAAAMATRSPAFVAGFISVRPALWPQPAAPGLVHMTPGVQLAAGGDALGQQYITPADVIGAGGSDVIIVGRGIIAAADPAGAAAIYQAAGWAAYEAAL